MAALSKPLGNLDSPLSVKNAGVLPVTRAENLSLFCLLVFLYFTKLFPLNGSVSPSAPAQPCLLQMDLGFLFPREAGPQLPGAFPLVTLASPGLRTSLYHHN